MNKSLSSLRKWAPVDAIPEAMPWQVKLAFGPGHGTDVSMRFSSGTLVVRFPGICAILVFEEFCDTYWGHNFAMRFCDYALWKVHPSAWLEEFSNFTLPPDRNEYEHYCLGGFDGTIHLLNAGEPDVFWLE